MDLDSWWAGGTRLSAGVFTRCDGPSTAPATTWLHGFPISSWDWAKLHAELGSQRRDVTLDFLGFGASAKPRQRYSILHQADLVEEVWRHWGVTTTSLVAHDYGVSIAQELLARQAQGLLEVQLDAVTFFNGGIFPELHRPTAVQRVLAGPMGVALAPLMSQSMFVRGYRAVLAQPPPDLELREHWRAMAREGGHRNVHRILGYISERRVHRDRWVGAMLSSGLPTTCVWGPDDPVSGAHVLPSIREQMPNARLHVLTGLGHAPHMEYPSRVAEVLTEE